MSIVMKSDSDTLVECVSPFRVTQRPLDKDNNLLIFEKQLLFQLTSCSLTPGDQLYWQHALSNQLLIWIDYN